MIKPHYVPEEHFAALAAGYGGSDTIDLLKRAELSKRLLRLKALVDLGPSQVEPAYSVLSEIQRHAPETVTDILLYPHVGAWARSCLRQLVRSTADPTTLELDLLHLGGIAGAAALRARTEATVRVPVRQGIVALPSLGSAVVGPAALTRTAVLRCADGRMEIEVAGRVIALNSDAGGDSTSWRSVRTLRIERSGHVLDVRLDDLDPFRGGPALRPAPRLTASEVSTWRERLGHAWEILVHHHPDRAVAISAGLRTIVPLTHQGGYRGISATVADAFGSVAMSAPTDALLLAEGLVHEFQHAKLGALLSLVTLYDPAGAERYYAPWRDDPRPLGGLLHGIYAFLGVTDFWSRQLRADGHDQAFAEFQFALWREQTGQAINSLTASERLTPLGLNFADGMRTALTRLSQASVRAEARALAEDAASDHRLIWRLHHMRPDPHAIVRLADAWLTGALCPQINVPARIGDEESPRAPSVRAELRFRWIRSLRGNSDPEADIDIGSLQSATPADAACVQRAYRKAGKGYRVQLTTQPENIEAWAGLSLVLSRTETGPAVELLRSRPEVVVALHRRIRELTGSAPDPVDLASWLTEILRTGSTVSG